MLDITKLKLFPFFTKEVSIPINDESKYNIIFMTENSNFESAYPKLRIRRQYAKKITIAPFKVPRLVVSMKHLSKYKSLGLMPTLKAEENTFIDTTPFFRILDDTYSKGSYRRPMVLSKAVGYLNSCKKIGAAKKNILIYHIDQSISVAPAIINRRAIILAMIAKLGEGKFPFDSVIIAIQSGGIRFSAIYQSDQKPLAVGKIVSILKKLKPGSDMEQDIKPEIIHGTEPKPKPKQQNDNERSSILKTIDKYQKDKLTT